MKLEELLKETKTPVRYDNPKTLHNAVKEYQKVERKRYSRKPTNKKILFVKLGLIGLVKFKGETAKMQREIDKYNKIC